MTATDRTGQPPLPELGVGITFAPELEPLLAARPELFDLLEFEPQTSWVEQPAAAEPFRADERVLARLAAYPMRKLVHSVGAPVGGGARPDPAQLALLRAAVERLGSPWASDHLSFNSTPEYRTGFFLPPRQTAAGVAQARAAIDALAAGLGVPVAVETGVNYLRPRPDELGDGEFVAAVTAAADCGLLLDLHNIFANAMNGRETVADFLAATPLERVWEIHLAGGMELDGFYVDAHSGAIPDPLFEAARLIVARLPNLKAIVFEIFPTYIEDVGAEVIYAQMRRLRELWHLRGTAVGAPLPAPRRAPAASAAPSPAMWAAPSDAPSPAVWEAALGNLAIGRPPAADPLSRELAADPGARLVATMVREFRASMLVRVLPMSLRLLLLTLGADAVRGLMADCWARIPPQLYASGEAAAFANYLAARRLPVPHLGEVVAFEAANAASLVDGLPRAARFTVDPAALFACLAAGQPPPADLPAADITITLTAAGPQSPALTGPARGFPFH